MTGAISFKILEAWAGMLSYPYLIPRDEVYFFYQSLLPGPETDCSMLMYPSLVFGCA